MRVFLCSYADSGFSLAIPMENISSVFLLSKEDLKFNQQTFSDGSFIYNNTENNNVYVSLPVIFDCSNANVRHGIILNKINDENIVLFTTEIDSEVEIPDGNFYSLPKAFSTLLFSDIFNGFLFNFEYTNKSNGDLILLLNPNQLIQYVKKEKI
ncbi:MAG: hypothetical protein FWD47_00620 [Treponema sp.]|nr:hypothetical protein [Treponema sp.]